MFGFESVGAGFCSAGACGGEAAEEGECWRGWAERRHVGRVEECQLAQMTLIKRIGTASIQKSVQW